MNQLDLSIIVASYNTRDLLCGCLRSIYENTFGITFEIIVVDDCSPDDSPEMVEREFPQVVLVRNRSNLRYTKTNNAGLAAARGRYGLLLNSDTEVLPGAFETLVKFMDENPQAAAAGPKLINPDGSVQHCIRSFPSLATMFFQTLNLQLIWPSNPFTEAYYNTKFAYDKPKVVQSIGTTSFIVRRSIWEEDGMLDERFTYAFVDLAYCHMLGQRGRLIYIVPDAVVLHYGSMSINQKGIAEVYRQHDDLRRFYDLYVSQKDGSLKKQVVRLCIQVRKILKVVEFKLSKDKRLTKGPGAPSLKVAREAQALLQQEVSSTPESRQA